MRKPTIRLPGQPIRGKKSGHVAEMHRESPTGALCNKRSYFQTPDPVLVTCQDCKAMQEGREKPSVAARKALEESRPPAERDEFSHTWRPVNTPTGSWACDTCDVVPTARAVGQGIISWLNGQPKCKGKKE